MNLVTSKDKPGVIIENTASSIDPEVKKKYIETYGEKELGTAHIFSCIVTELKNNPNPRPHVLIQIIRQFFKAISSKDPMSFHQDIARISLLELLGEEKKDTNRNYYVDLLAREFCETCNKIGDKIFSIPEIASQVTELNKIATALNLKESAFDVVDIPLEINKEIDQKCFTKTLFTPLHIYLKELERLGIKGKEHARKIRVREVNARGEFWFIVPPAVGKFFFFSPAFIGLSKRIWDDKISKRVSFDEKFPPCIVKPTFGIIKSLMLSTLDKTSNKNAITFVEGTALIGKIDIPVIPSAIIDKVFKGIDKFKTVIGHKMMRYAVSLPYEQRIKGIEDYRVKEFDGGFAELARDMGIDHKNTIADLREFLYALKYLDVSNIQENKLTSGRLIDINQYKSPKTGREDGLTLTVLPTLVGFGEIDCKGMLLIPIVTLSPPVEMMAKPYHASLYLLQMNLVEEFSNKSKELYQHKCIQLIPNDFDRLLIKSNIPLSFKDRILKGWTSDSNNAPRVVKQVDKDHYALGEAYSRQSRFLEGQGRVRIQKSQEGKEKAFKKKNKRR